MIIDWNTIGPTAADWAEVSVDAEEPASPLQRFLAEAALLSSHDTSTGDEAGGHDATLGGLLDRQADAATLQVEVAEPVTRGAATVAVRQRADAVLRTPLAAAA